MRFETQTQLGTHKLPSTLAYKLLDDQLVLFVRPWGSQDYNQKLVDEITHYLSTAQADIEITSPFDNLETLSSLANKIRISLLLAHDYFYKIENKTSYSVGFEVAILMRHKNELAWGAVGRFDINAQGPKFFQQISTEATDRDQTVLLPVELLGVERDVAIRCGSLNVQNEEIIVSSLFGSAAQWIKEEKSDSRDGSATSSVKLEADADTTYWLSKIRSE